MNEGFHTYHKLFEGSAADGTPRRVVALKFASETRKFEIELYWKRAAYFWAFCAVALGGFMAALGSEKVENRAAILVLLSCIGLVFSWSWYLVNRASKFWQLNWEHHVDLLEDKEMGPLYKTVLDPGARFFSVAGPLMVSASKLNQLLSLFVTLLFGAMLCATLVGNYALKGKPDVLVISVLTLTVSALVGLPLLARITAKEGDKNRPKVNIVVRQMPSVQYACTNAKPSQAAKGDVRPVPESTDRFTDDSAAAPAPDGG
jgi:hypothetical protein